MSNTASPSFNTVRPVHNDVRHNDILFSTKRVFEATEIIQCGHRFTGNDILPLTKVELNFITSESGPPNLITSNLTIYDAGFGRIKLSVTKEM